VAKVLRRGYRTKDRILRPAQVSIFINKVVQV
jgi:molecular chaperone GrpE (heat shock protein)